MNTKTITYGLEDIPAIAAELKGMMSSCKVFTFVGPLGAGKTTLIKELLAQCGVTQTINSPTFTYMNVYENEKNQLFYHFDLYRINSLDEFLAAGFNEYIYLNNSWAFVEWPAVIMPLLQEKVCMCDIAYNDEQRIITITTTERDNEL